MARERNTSPERGEKKTGFLNTVREFLFGFATHDHLIFTRRTQASMGDLMTVALFGDMLGVPMIRPYYALRLLPYVLPRLPGWKRRMLKERDFVEALD
ncbi:MAG: hypothetical protein H6Q55_1530 [Deltaproteobacteria bacterium]|jgi:hypothetical protein|nr:hypothetical protein [Deltaproteobacteria bacterium]